MNGAADGEPPRAWLSRIHDDLLPFAKALLHDAEAATARAGAGHPDLERILTAARTLAAIIEGLAGPGVAPPQLLDGPPAAAQQALRHELRTPLNAIKGYGEMLLEDVAGPEGAALRADLGRLVAAASDMLWCVDRAAQVSVIAAEGRAPDAIIDLLKVASPAADGPKGAASGHILVVDDVEANRDLLSRRLIRDGHRVATASGGQAALDALCGAEFDLVLLDLMMPDISGLDVLRRMKEDIRLRRVPVIMITALTETESAIRCIEAGAVDYLPKPFDPVLLRARIGACLERKQWRDREQDYVRRLEHETAKFERLLLSILPRQVIGRLNDGESIIADRFDEASVLFADLVGFTAHSADTPPAAMVEYLNRLYSEFDTLAHSLGVEKIKTIGDAYMAVAGVPVPRADHRQAIAHMALGMIERLTRVNREFGSPLRVRIGIHSGPVVAGIIGTHRFLYDVWGDTVNVASRLESQSLPNRVHASQEAARGLAGAFALEPRGTIDVKGKGALETFFVGAL
jgi:adenylate cyclase